MYAFHITQQLEHVPPYYGRALQLPHMPFFFLHMPYIVFFAYALQVFLCVCLIYKYITQQPEHVPNHCGRPLQLPPRQRGV